MKDYLFETETWLPTDRETIFSFFKEAANLERITPPWLNFSIHTPLPIEMKQGQLIDYHIRMYGIPMRWRTEITEWDPPFAFVDTQIQGPYRKWVHTHTFEQRNGGTWMQDRVQYSLPGGILSRIPHALIVRRNIEEIFRYRKSRISEIFAADALASAHPYTSQLLERR